MQLYTLAPRKQKLMNNKELYETPSNTVVEVKIVIAPFNEEEIW